MNKIYVGNLPYTVTERDLEASFEQFGTIDTINLITDRATGRSKGFGFVSFDEASSAEAALSLNGTDLSGRKMIVNIARERERK